jgi:hypothetical protein
MRSQWEGVQDVGESLLPLAFLVTVVIVGQRGAEKPLSW